MPHRFIVLDAFVFFMIHPGSTRFYCLVSHPPLVIPLPSDCNLPVLLTHQQVVVMAVFVLGHG